MSQQPSSPFDTTEAPAGPPTRPSVITRWATHPALPGLVLPVAALATAVTGGLGGSLTMVSWAVLALAAGYSLAGSV